MHYMTLSAKAQSLYDQIQDEKTNLGDLRKTAAAIKKDHELANELWSSKTFMARMLAILIMDVKQLSEELISVLFDDMMKHPEHERLQLADWLMANQLTKDKRTLALLNDWEKSPSPLKRRIFWYHQGRLRWMGKIPEDNAQKLLAAIEATILTEASEVQWAMNFTAGWIGVFDVPYSQQCIQLGETTGLYKDEVVHKNCTPNYLPKFIAIEKAKRKL